MAMDQAQSDWRQTKMMAHIRSPGIGCEVLHGYSDLWSPCISQKEGMFWYGLKGFFVYPRHPNTSCEGIWTSETYLQGMTCDTFVLTIASFGTFDFYCNYVKNTYPGKLALSTIHSKVGNENACNKSILLWGHTDPALFNKPFFVSLLYCRLQQVPYQHATSRSGLHLHTQKTTHL